MLRPGCPDPDAPHRIVHRIVHVASTPAGVADAAAARASIPEHFADRQLLPERQLVDAGYRAAAVRSANQARFGGDVLGPTRGTFRWQAQAQTGFAGQHCAVAWAAKPVSCPPGRASR
jgi:hypothetical protein